jgi:hypothetical protein
MGSMDDLAPQTCVVCKILLTNAAESRVEEGCEHR